MASIETEICKVNNLSSVIQQLVGILLCYSQSVLAYVCELLNNSGCHVYEWDIATGMFTRSLTGHSRPLTCVGVSYCIITAVAVHVTVGVYIYPFF